MSADERFLDRVASPRFCGRLFAHLPDVVFCLKDRERRYQAANPAFAGRLGMDDPRKLLGHTAEKFFPPHLAETSRDLDSPREEDLMLAGVARIVAHIQAHLDIDLRLVALVTRAGLSPTQLDRRMRRVFPLTPAQFIRKSRIEHSVRLLTTTALPVAEIALTCGYGDQTAFTRQFRTMVGMPPAAYRDHTKRHG
ncbi:MAG: AraC family transcriptional regulator [Akkermansiaceae bacterium]|nr:AraC family transcriptional regulator [Akkermansiaceae bacterium]MCF7732880.1 AraC family transcriptional regulator [Akkermansiaceae bacterium]